MLMMSEYTLPSPAVSSHLHPLTFCEDHGLISTIQSFEESVLEKKEGILMCSRAETNAKIVFPSLVLTCVKLGEVSKTECRYTKLNTSFCRMMFIDSVVSKSAGLHDSAFYILCKYSQKHTKLSTTINWRSLQSRNTSSIIQWHRCTTSRLTPPYADVQGLIVLVMLMTNYLRSRTRWFINSYFTSDDSSALNRQLLTSMVFSKEQVQAALQVWLNFFDNKTSCQLQALFLNSPTNSH